MRHFGGARLLALLVGIIASVPAFAPPPHWIYIGTRGDNADKIVVDIASLQKLGRFTLVNIMTVYAEPRMNAHDITMDRFVQRTAIDCARHSFVGVTTVGYLHGKPVGSSSEKPDWRAETVPIPDDATSERIFHVVCTSPAP
jgi:hypothetical protein